MICTNDCYNCENPICKCDNEVFSAKKKKNGKGQRKTNKYERKRKYKEKLMRTLDIEREPDDYLYGSYGAKYSSYYLFVTLPFIVGIIFKNHICDVGGMEISSLRIMLIEK